jgi:hypothetical protein
MVGPRKAALAEESAEVEVLFANMDKMKSLTKKIQASVNRLDASGKAVQEAISPIYGNTQKLQIANTNIDRVLEARGRAEATCATTLLRSTAPPAPSQTSSAAIFGPMRKPSPNLPACSSWVTNSWRMSFGAFSKTAHGRRCSLWNTLQSVRYACRSHEHVLTRCRESISPHIPRKALHLTSNQRPHLQVVRTSIPNRSLADPYTAHIRRRQR